MYRLLLSAIAGAVWMTAAAADNHLHGTYAFTGVTTCIADSASLGFNPNLTPIGSVTFSTHTIAGTRVFHGDGTSTVTGRDLAIDPPPGPSATSSDFSFKSTYTVDSGGKLTIALIQGSFSSTILTGPRTGQSYVSAIPDQTGVIGDGARTIVLTQPDPIIESLTFSNGDAFLRICNRSTTLIRTHDEQE